MNYQEMSDFEINIAVGKMILEYEEIKQSPQDGKALVLWGDGCNWRGFNPCNSWADAGPIIKDNDISIIKLQTKWMAISPGSGIESYIGEDDEPCLYGEGFEYKNGNPLRASMIVFLMMKGGE